MVRYAQSLGEIMDAVYLPAKIFGVAPFDKKLNKVTKKYYYKTRPIGLQHLLINGGVIAYVMFTAGLRLINEIYEQKITVPDIIIGGVFVFLQFFTAAMVLYFVLKQKHFVRCLELVETLDRIFTKLNLKFSYKLFQIGGYILLFFVTPLYTFYVTFPFWKLPQIIEEEYFCSYRCRNMFLQFINLPVDHVIRHIPMYFFSVISYIAYDRLRGLNEYIVQIEQCESKDYETVDKLLSQIMHLHNLIFRLTREIGQVFSLPILFVITHTFFEIMAIMATFKYTVNLNVYQASLTLGIYVSEMILQLIICQALKFEAENLRRTEWRIALPYFHKDLALKRKCLLLQMTHEKMVITANQFYDLDMTVVTAHMGILLTISMFLLRLREFSF